MVFTCSGDANPPVKSGGYTLYREGRVVGFGQNQTISDVLPDDSGRYHCQAWNGIIRAGVDTFTSAAVLLQVYCKDADVNSATAAVADVPAAAGGDDDDDDLCGIPLFSQTPQRTFPFGWTRPVPWRAAV